MKELKLFGSNKVALVDDEDYERLIGFTWYVRKNNCVQRFHIRLKGGSQKSISLASEIMHQLEQMFDHKDRDGLNNQKYNLRPCNQSQNMMNRTKTKNCSSIYKGVCWSKLMRKWHARIKINGKVIHLGYFTDEKVAAIAYNNKAVELFKEFANLNNV